MTNNEAMCAGKGCLGVRQGRMSRTTFTELAQCLFLCRISHWRMQSNGRRHVVRAGVHRTSNGNKTGHKTPSLTFGKVAVHVPGHCETNLE